MHKVTHKIDDKVVHISREFEQAHIDAGYHEQEWGEHSHAGHSLLGRHSTPNGKVNVEHTDGEPVFGEREEDGKVILLSGAITHGPEFKLTWDNGASVQCLDDASVVEHLGFDPRD